MCDMKTILNIFNTNEIMNIICRELSLQDMLNMLSIQDIHIPHEIIYWKSISEYKVLKDTKFLMKNIFEYIYDDAIKILYEYISKNDRIVIAGGYPSLIFFEKDLNMFPDSDIDIYVTDDIDGSHTIKLIEFLNKNYNISLSSPESRSDSVYSVINVSIETYPRVLQIICINVRTIAELLASFDMEFLHCALHMNNTYITYSALCSKNTNTTQIKGHYNKETGEIDYYVKQLRINKAYKKGLHVEGYDEDKEIIHVPSFTTKLDICDILKFGTIKIKPVISFQNAYMKSVYKYKYPLNIVSNSNNAIAYLRQHTTNISFDDTENIVLSYEMQPDFIYSYNIGFRCVEKLIDRNPIIRYTIPLLLKGQLLYDNEYRKKYYLRVTDTEQYGIKYILDSIKSLNLSVKKLLFDDLIDSSNIMISVSPNIKTLNTEYKDTIFDPFSINTKLYSGWSNMGNRLNNFLDNTLKISINECVIPNAIRINKPCIDIYGGKFQYSDEDLLCEISMRLILYMNGGNNDKCIKILYDIKNIIL